MDSFWQIFFFLILFFIGLTITPASSQPQPQSCNDLSSLLNCNYHSSASNSKLQIPENSSLLNHVSEPNIKNSSRIDYITTLVSYDDNENLDKSMTSIIKVHGILSGIGWGIMVPIGAMTARYLRAFEASRSSWFNVHWACQILAFITGTTSVVLGICIVIMSEQFSVHACIGIVIFFASFIQVVLALYHRPKEEDRERFFWNIAHCLIGYGVIILAIFNMFKGFSNNYGTWKNAYLAIIVSLGCVALILEVITWFLVCKNRKKEEGEGEGDDDNP